MDALLKEMGGSPFTMYGHSKSPWDKLKKYLIILLNYTSIELKFFKNNKNWKVTHVHLQGDILLN